jgi:hypothetical protein
VIKTLENEIVERAGFNPRLGHAVDAPGDHDLVCVGLIAQPQGQIGDAADRGVF